MVKNQRWGPINILFIAELGNIEVNFNGGKIDLEVVKKCRDTLNSFLLNTHQEDVDKYNAEVDVYRECELEKRIVKHSKPSGYVYIYKQDKYYKIGKSKYKDCRKYKYITENPNKIELITSVYVSDYSGVEKTLHETFSSKKHNREWFLLSEDDLNHAEFVLTFEKVHENSNY